jgi:hypothetical protein
MVRYGASRSRARGECRRRVSYDDARRCLCMCLIQVRSRDESVPRAGHDYGLSHLEEGHANFQTRGRDPSLSPLLKALRGFFQETSLVGLLEEQTIVTAVVVALSGGASHVLRTVLKRARGRIMRAHT